MNISEWKILKGLSIGKDKYGIKLQNLQYLSLHELTVELAEKSNIRINYLLTMIIFNVTMHNVENKETIMKFVFNLRIYKRCSICEFFIYTFKFQGNFN